MVSCTPFGFRVFRCGLGGCVCVCCWRIGCLFCCGWWGGFDGFGVVAKCVYCLFCDLSCGIWFGLDLVCGEDCDCAARWF